MSNANIKRLNVQEKKEFSAKIKLKAKEYGYKVASETVFYKKNKYLITCDYVFPVDRAVIYTIGIKPLVYDDIFWNILGWDDLIGKRLSVRVTKVSAPLIQLKRSKLEISDEFDEVIEKIISQMKPKADEFINNYNFDEYVINYVDSQENLYRSYYNPILKCLAYINLGRLGEAKNIAKDPENHKMPYMNCWGEKTIFDFILDDRF